MQTLFQQSSVLVVAFFLLSVQAGCHAPAVEQVPTEVAIARLLQSVDAKSDEIVNGKLVFPPRNDVVMPKSLRDLLRREDVKYTNLCYGFEIQNGKPGWFWRSSPNMLRMIGDQGEVTKTLHAHMSENGFEPYESADKWLKFGFRKQFEDATETAKFNCLSLTGEMDSQLVAVECPFSWRVEFNQPSALPTFTEVRRALPTVDPPLRKSEPSMLLIEQLPEFPVDLVDVRTHGRGNRGIAYRLVARVPDSAMNTTQREGLAEQVVEVLSQNGYKQFKPQGNPPGDAFHRPNEMGAFHVRREASYLEFTFAMGADERTAFSQYP